MKTVIRPTQEHHETLDKLTNAFTKLSKSYDSEEIKQLNAEIDEAFNTLNRLYDEHRLIETVEVDE